MAKVQIKRTATPNAAPPVGLVPGELAVEMDTPARLWTGVPTSIDPSGRKLIVETGIDYISTPGDNMTGPLVTHGAPYVPATDNPMQVAHKRYVDQFHLHELHSQTVVYYTIGANTWTAVLSLMPTTPEFDGNRFTPKIAGLYSIGGAVNAASLGGNHGLCIWKNGGPTNFSKHTSFAGNTLFSAIQTVSGGIYFNGTTDYVELCVLTDYGGTDNVLQALFWGCRMSSP